MHVHMLPLLQVVQSSCPTQAAALKKRIARHRTHPNARMAADVAACKPFDAFFEVKVIMRTAGCFHADRPVRLFIKDFKATGPDGHNALPGTPGRMRQFYAMKKAMAARARTA
jgi:hypothetical protein